jgi:hypothetical protein
VVIKVPLDVLTHCICIKILVSANTLEKVCEKMLTHVHKVLHLVVGTFDARVVKLEKWRRLPEVTGCYLGSDRTWRPAFGQ